MKHIHFLGPIIIILDIITFMLIGSGIIPGSQMYIYEEWFRILVTIIFTIILIIGVDITIMKGNNTK